jgi:hypothetical protein
MPRSAATDLARRNKKSGISSVVFTEPYYHIYGYPPFPERAGIQFIPCLHETKSVDLAIATQENRLLIGAVLTSVRQLRGLSKLPQSYFQRSLTI